MEPVEFEKECLIRDEYGQQIDQLKPGQIVIGRETSYEESKIRVDLQTVDQNDVFREWEFKLYADYKALGQVLTYVTQRKLETNFDTEVIGVIAAFEFQPELVKTIRVLNLAIELVTVPNWLANAGKVLSGSGSGAIGQAVNFKKYDLQEVIN
ncbi:hypothetical protein J0K78_10535 [Halobacillus sp. GSS1]|uniref:hypothetical protein n=1 Tax=Halobacillus sp. GSS1 TaxID=2815919 RepID=UPI001A8DADC4|nr:hypothetical protein [Halobacillus sp. GSS1]MBN9654700.1 hypothetical protein [Halobacillus sp. GSS1]